MGSPTCCAMAYAERQHAGQLRAGYGAPFITHPLEVTSLLYHETGVRDERREREPELLVGIGSGR